MPVDFVVLAETAETLTMEPLSAAVSDDLFSPSTSTSYAEENVPQVTPSMGELRNEGSKRSRNRKDDLNLSSAIENVQNYFKSKAENKGEKENVSRNKFITIYQK